MQCSFYTHAITNNFAELAKNQRLSLGADDLHIHLLRPELYPGIYNEVLDAFEQQRAASFKFNKDRDLYSAAHVFLRQVLSCYAPVRAKDWQFICNPYGKPAIANPGYLWLHFNLSHTQGMVACAVANNCAVGVDVERRKHLEDLPSLCQQVFSTLEAEAVLAHKCLADREHWFFNYWTLKEAYIKARGLGLSLSLQTFSFVQKIDHSWSLSYDAHFDNDGKNWSVGTHLLKDNIYLAYCLQV